MKSATIEAIAKAMNQNTATDEALLAYASFELAMACQKHKSQHPSTVIQARRHAIEAVAKILLAFDLHA